MQTNNLITAMLLAVCLMTIGCSPEVGSERWCEAMKAKSKGDWTANEAVDFTRHCIFKSAEVGSEPWCEALREKPKGDWSANEAADYTRYCVFK